MLSWVVLLLGVGLAGTGYYMHFVQHRSHVEVSEYTTASWITYGHFGVVLAVFGLVGVVLSILA